MVGLIVDNGPTLEEVIASLPRLKTPELDRMYAEFARNMHGDQIVMIESVNPLPDNMSSNPLFMIARAIWSELGKRPDSLQRPSYPI